MLRVFLLLIFCLGIWAQCDPSVELCPSDPTDPTDNEGGDGNGDGTTPDPVDPDFEYPDVCGVINGDGTSCLGCDGQPYPSGGAPVLDACGICGGDGSTCCGTGPCSGHGACVDAQCVCLEGWIGQHCESPSEVCEGVVCDNGYCGATGKCVCPEGWMGSRCQLRTCTGHGAYDREHNTCACLPGWTGADCQRCDTSVVESDDDDGDLTWMCLGPKKLRLVDRVQADMAIRLHGNKTVFRPGTIVHNVLYDCECRPVKFEPYQARAFSVLDAEDALNDILFNQVSRFINTSADLRAEVKSTKDQFRKYQAWSLRSFFISDGVIVLLSIFMVFVLGITWDWKIRK